MYLTPAKARAGPNVESPALEAAFGVYINEHSHMCELLFCFKVILQHDNVFGGFPRTQDVKHLPVPGYLTNITADASLRFL